MRAMNELFGTIAVVTGASSGIGRAAVERLINAGCSIAAFARTAAPLEELASGNPAQVIAVSGDVTDENDVERLFASVEKRFGPVDLVVNSAGTIDPAPLVDTTLERWEKMFAVNVHGSFLTCRRALPSMLERRHGTIVNIASISGIPGPTKFPGFVSYCASKGAVISMTEALAVEVGPHGVRVNCISPGSVDTPMWAEASGGAAAAMTPDEIAETIVFLASDRSRPMNGQNLHVYSS
jgi:NAD(P)-dependent dehydrogenase (short-subunit alcohol dehydrogenase family)